MATDGARDIEINIRCTNSEKATVRGSLDMTVREFKQVVESTLGVPAVQQRLIHKGRVLKDDATMESYGIVTGDAVHMVKGVAPPSTNNTQAATPSAVNTTPTNNNTNNTNRNMFMDMGSLGSMNGMEGLGGFLNNPELMQQMMSSPAMDQLLNNPEIMRSMMTNNPQMQALMEANPQLRHIMNDPQIIRQTMEMMRNPNAMREAMRSQDLAMSQLENLPGNLFTHPYNLSHLLTYFVHLGGFNALRRMYEDIQEPMMEASQSMYGNNSSSSSNNSSSSSSSPASTTPNTSALPNPWSNQRSPATTGLFGGLGSPAGANPFAGMNPGANPFGGMNPGSNPFAGLNAGGANPFGGMTNPMANMSPQQISALMSNPMIMEQTRNMMNNPAMRAQIARMNPQLGQILEDPSMRAMLTNPQMMSLMSDPNTMQAMRQLEPLMTQMRGMGLGPMPNAASNNLDFSALLGGLSLNGTPGTNSNLSTTQPTTSAPVNSTDFNTLYASQLQQLQDMGFADVPSNIRALQATGGNVNAAVERLLSGL